MEQGWTFPEVTVTLEFLWDHIHDLSRTTSHVWRELNFISGQVGLDSLFPYNKLIHLKPVFVSKLKFIYNIYICCFLEITSVGSPEDVRFYEPYNMLQLAHSLEGVSVDLAEHSAGTQSPGISEAHVVLQIWNSVCFHLCQHWPIKSYRLHRKQKVPSTYWSRSSVAWQENSKTDLS